MLMYILAVAELLCLCIFDRDRAAVLMYFLAVAELLCLYIFDCG